ncbi:MAG: hypothetical protein VX197_05485 [Pseudomonadota bacterium]|nr:hypothetical protein [Pseudomonadales bacterium]MEE3300661.1 hypothetical protein [Pseudomonadota bacterium]
MHKIFVAYLLLFSQVIWAAENATEQPTEDQVNEEATLDTELTSEEITVNESNDLGSGNGEDEQETEEEGQSNGRFIPTEQISQDLGVSFPVDI